MVNGKKIGPLDTLEHGQLPDPEAQAIKCLVDRINKLEEMVKNLHKKKDKEKIAKLKSIKNKQCSDLDDYISGEGI